MTKIDEIAPDVFRLSTYIAEFDLQFNQFLVRDEEPLLYHSGMVSLFPTVYEAVARLINPADLRWISFSHFEADECGALNKWLEVAPRSQAAANMLGAAISVDDFAIRPSRPLMDGEVFSTGAKRFRFIQTPHLPHGWDAGMLYEETGRVLFTSDLFHQIGEYEALTSTSLIDRARQTMLVYQAGPFADYQPYTRRTGALFNKLAEHEPQVLATMHGSSYTGDGRQQLLELGQVIRELNYEFYPQQTAPALI